MNSRSGSAGIAPSSAVMFASAVVALLIGIFADKSPWLLLPLMLVYAITVPADSGALTSGMSMAADPELSRRDHGDAFHRRLQPVRAWRVGGGCRAGCCGRTAEFSGLDGGVFGAGGRHSAWAAGALLVEKRDAEHEPQPAFHHCRARHHADAGLGFELLPAGDPGRSDRARSRRFLELDLCRLLGIAGHLGHARPAHRPADRSGRRPVGAVDFQPRCWPRGSPCSASPTRSRCCSPPGCCSASAWARASTTPPSARSAASMATRRAARSPASP